MRSNDSAAHWQVHGRRALYTSNWVSLWLEDVEVPGEGRLEHHVIRAVRPSVAIVVTNESDRVLLMWRHRFITNRWGWEIPAGWVEEGESPVRAARREVEEETGWRPVDGKRILLTARQLKVDQLPRDLAPAEPGRKRVLGV